jgi:hypothetical protein
MSTFYAFLGDFSLSALFCLLLVAVSVCILTERDGLNRGCSFVHDCVIGAGPFSAE